MRTELKPLTGLRGIGAVAVMFYHYGQPFGSRGLDTHFHLRQGYLAVDCFYILSGFVLAYSYGAWFSGRFDLARFGDFMLRRVARLYPAYLTVMLFVLVKAVINVSGNGALNNFSTYDYVLNTLMLTGVGLNVFPVISDSWSVSAEMVAYLLFPILVFLSVFCRPVIGAAVFCVAAGVLLLVAQSGLGVRGALDVVDGSSVYPILRCLAGFTIGLLLFRISELPVLRLLMASEHLCALTIFAFIGAWVLHAPDLVLVACLTALIFGLSFNGSLANRLFGNRPVHYLGEISYSLYLIHPTFISGAVMLALIAQHRFGIYGIYPILAAMCWVLSIILAGISARWIEAPGRRFVLGSVSRLVPSKSKAA